jgi:DNA-directed RNA polymerase subunit omega
MARITVEDCTRRIPNRFELVRVAAMRTKQLKRGARPVVWSPNKEAVTALREIAEGRIRVVHLEPEPKRGGSRQGSTMRGRPRRIEVVAAGG